MDIYAVRAAAGPRFPIYIRVSADDMIAGRNKIEDKLELLQ
jgi:2,4-dienoyl-CoA reductase-like NADH-dependent reductase (Old Yellow Enzyme family)